mgnify:CR=1 FL=1
MNKKARIRDSRDALRKINEVKKLIASASHKCNEIPDLIRPILNPNLRQHKQIKEDADELDLDISVKLAEMMVAIKELEKFLKG